LWRYRDDDSGVETVATTFILALTSEALAGTASLKHVIVGVSGQIVEVALSHVAVARVAHHVYNIKTHCALHEVELFIVPPDTSLVILDNVFPVNYRT